MMTTSNDQKSHLTHVIIIAGLIIANMVVTVWSSQQAEKLEIMKVGGKENYEKLQLIMQSDSYKEQYAQNLDIMLEQIQGDASATGFEDMPTEDMTVTGDMSADTVSGVMVDDTATQDSEATIDMIDMNEAQG